MQASPISVEGPQHLPFPPSPTSCCIQCSAQDPRVFEVPTSSDGVSSVAVHQLKELGEKKDRPPSTLQKSQSVQWWQLAEVHSPLRVVEQAPPTVQPSAQLTPVFLTHPATFPPMLISIGPNTSAVLDCFKMSDGVLPQLWMLISTVCSSRWEAVLRSPQWNLTYEQAVNLSRALNADTQCNVGARLEKVSKNIFTTSLLVLNTAPVLVWSIFLWVPCESDWLCLSGLVHSLHCRPNASLDFTCNVICREIILIGPGSNALAMLLKYIGLGCEQTHAPCHLSHILFREANRGWFSLPFSHGPKPSSPKKPVKSSLPSNRTKVNISSRTSTACGNRSTMQQRPLHWPTTRVSIMSSVNYTLDTIHFAQGAPSPLCGTLSVGKKKKKTENGRNKVLKVCYASHSLSVCLSDILTPQVSFQEARPHFQPLCNRRAKSTRHSQQRKRRLSLKSIRLTGNARPLDCTLPPSWRSTTSLEHSKLSRMRYVIYFPCISNWQVFTM